MNIHPTEITIPNIRLNLDQLLTIIRYLDKPARIEVAKVLAETETDGELEELIFRLKGIPEKTEEKKKKRKPGSAKGMIFMSDDFDAPLEESIIEEFYK